MFAVPVGTNLEKNTALAAECTGVDGNGNPVPAGCTLPLGTCTYTFNGETKTGRVTEQYCKSPAGYNNTSLGYQFVSWVKSGNQNAAPLADPANEALANAENQKKPGLEGELQECGFGFKGSIFPGCFQQLSYILFVTVPSFLMGVTANFFNFMAALTLTSDLYNSGFIAQIWKVVRDFANIFFILILLYAAFSIILNLGHGGGKKIIANVIIIALLVNFSLFMARVVIDASNIVALIFYNRVEVQCADGTDSCYKRIINKDGAKVQDKDMAGALVSPYKITTFFSDDTIKNLKAAINKDTTGQVESGSGQTLGKLTPYFIIGIMIAYGLVAFALTYAFLVAGLAFLVRIINLIMLMVVAPFAFVSFAVPKFRSIDTIGFDSWIKKLFESAFVAAIFIFILYIISQVLKADIFATYATENPGGGFFRALLLVFIPAILVVIMLLKGAKYAKKASGEFTGAIIGGAKMLGGAALGAGLGVAALAGTQTLGRAGMAAANSDKLRKDAIEGKGFAKIRAKALLGAGNFLGKRSYDVRQVGLAKTAAGKAGIKLADKGLGALGTKSFEKGRRGQIERKIEKNEEKITQTVLLTRAAANAQDNRAAQAKAQNIRAAQYETDKEKASKSPSGAKNPFFDESEFRAAYEKEHGSVDKVEPVKTAADVNKERREAFAISLQEGGVLKQIMRGIGKMIPVGAGTVATGAVAGSIGAGALAGGMLMVGGGVLMAIKSGIDKLDRTTAEVAAAARKGPTDFQKLIKEVTKMKEGGEKGTEKLGGEIKKAEEEHKKEHEEEGHEEKGH